MLHHDPQVAKAMRANIGAGFHFFTNSGFHKSRSVSGFESASGKYVFVVEHYRSAYMGGYRVQWPHSRVVRVDLSNGETDYLTKEGKPTSEMVNGRYVDNGEAHHYRGIKSAEKAARGFAERGES